MQSLYYPAVLGAALVFVLNKFSTYSSVIEAGKDITNYFGVFVLIYCSVIYLEIYLIRPKSYGMLAFISDFIEIIFLFLAFSALGFLEPTAHDKVNLQRFYLYASVAVISDQFWMIFVNKAEGLLLWFVCLGCTAVMIFGYLIGARYVWYNISILILFVVVFTWYFFHVRRDLFHTSR